MPILASSYLQEVTTKILRGAGAQENEASCVAAALVRADLAGHESHGVLRIIEYLNNIKAGHILPDTLPKIIQETPTTILVDGYRGFGQVIAGWVIDKLIPKANQSGLAGGGIFNCGHIGQIILVENQGDITANMINVAATLYDRNGNVVTVSSVQMQPDFLRSGDSSFFIIPIHEKSQSIHAVDYTLTAESDEYAAVPEFPLGSGALLVASVSSYIILSRNPEKIINSMSKVSKILSLRNN